MSDEKFASDDDMDLMESDNEMGGSPAASAAAAAAADAPRTLDVRETGNLLQPKRIVLHKDSDEEQINEAITLAETFGPSRVCHMAHYCVGANDEEADTDADDKKKPVWETDALWIANDIGAYPAKGKPTVKALKPDIVLTEIDDEGDVVTTSVPTVVPRKVGGMPTNALPFAKSALVKASGAQVSAALGTIGADVLFGHWSFIGGIVGLPGVCPVEPTDVDRFVVAPYGAFGDAEAAHAASVTLTATASDTVACRYAHVSLVRMTLAEYIEQLAAALADATKARDAEVSAKGNVTGATNERMLNIQSLLETARSYTTDAPATDALGSGVDPTRITLTLYKYRPFEKSAVLKTLERYAPIADQPVDDKAAAQRTKDLKAIMVAHNTTFVELCATLPLNADSDERLRKVVRAPLLPHFIWFEVKKANKKKFLELRAKIKAIDDKKAAKPTTPKKPAAKSTTPKKPADKPTTPKKPAAKSKKSDAKPKTPEPEPMAEDEPASEPAPTKQDIAEKTTAKATEAIVKQANGESATDFLAKASDQVVQIDVDKAEPEEKKAPAKKAEEKKAPAKKAEPKKAPAKKAEAKKAPAKKASAKKPKRKRDDENEGEVPTEIKVPERTEEQKAALDKLVGVQGKMAALPDDHKAVLGAWAGFDGELTKAVRAEIAAAARTLRFVGFGGLVERELEREKAALEQARKKKKVAFEEPVDEEEDDQDDADAALFD